MDTGVFKCDANATPPRTSPMTSVNSDGTHRAHTLHRYRSDPRVVAAGVGCSVEPQSAPLRSEGVRLGCQWR